MSRKRPGRPSRRVAARAPRSVYVFVEGAKTERQYVTAWRRLHRADINVTIDDLSGCAPRELVKAAREKKKADERAQRRGRGDAYDQYWCMFDRDNHAHWNEVLQTAAGNGIQVAVSNPCIELWFLLHFDTQQAWIERGKVQSLVKNHLTGSKSLGPDDFEALRANYRTARSRARDLDAKHEREDHGCCANPSSGVWRLVDYIIGDQSSSS